MAPSPPRKRRTSTTIRRKQAGTRVTKGIIKYSRQHRPSSINSLPTDVIVEVLARVASSSLTDLFNARLCCKEFLEATEEDYIYENVLISRERFPVIPWHVDEKEISFLRHCMESGNPEALYRQGMVDYFSSMKAETGLQLLKRAAQKGHAEASYVCGIILLCTEGKSSREGLNHLNFIKRASKSKMLKIQVLREKVKGIIRQMWIHSSIDAGARDGGRRPCACGRTHAHCSGARRGWPLDEDEYDEDVMSCEVCSWDREVTLFCNMLYGRPDHL
ncbi:hypothetical protein Ancab_018991 [Ancistrocladus abbreviatus]